MTGEKKILPRDTGSLLTIQGETVDLNKVKSSGVVYLLMDCSGSMAEGRKLQQAKEGLITFAVDAIAKGYLVGLIKFDTNATHISDPQKNIPALQSCINKMISTGSTNMTEAIVMATRKLIRVSGIRIMLIATDGYPNCQDSAIRAANNAKGMDIEIRTVGTDNADKSFLQKIATRNDLALKVPEKEFGKAISSMADSLKALPSGKKD